MDKTAYEHTVGFVLQKNAAWYDDAWEGLKKHYGENKELYHNTAIGAGGGGLLGLLMGGWKGGLGGAIAGGTAANLGTRWYDKYKADKEDQKALAEENRQLEQEEKEMESAQAAQAAEEAAKPKGPGMVRRWYDAAREAGQKAYQQSKDQRQADALLAQVKGKEGPATAKVRALFDEHLKNQREGGMAGAFARGVQERYNTERDALGRAQTAVLSGMPREQAAQAAVMLNKADTFERKRRILRSIIEQQNPQVRDNMYKQFGSALAEGYRGVGRDIARDYDTVRRGVGSGYTAATGAVDKGIQALGDYWDRGSSAVDRVGRRLLNILGGY